jgi:hypothetical protein
VGGYADSYLLRSTGLGHDRQFLAVLCVLAANAVLIGVVGASQVPRVPQQDPTAPGGNSATALAAIDGPFALARMLMSMREGAVSLACTSGPRPGRIRSQT